MNLPEFRQTITSGIEPEGLSKPLRSLWYDALGKWNEAHEAAQADHGVDAARVHAYLHRKEGDEANALYWYSRAHRPPVHSALEDEWEFLVNEFLNKLNKNTTLPESP